MILSMHACAYFVLTWYPGLYPSTASPLVLQSADHHVDDFGGFAGRVEDLIQTATFHRAAAPEFYNRGNRQTRLEWAEVRRYDSPTEAMAECLEMLAEMPQETGWLLIEIPAEGRAFACTPCMIRAASFPQIEKAGTIHVARRAWALECGPITEIAVDAEEGAILSEIGTEYLTEEEGYYLALEELT